MLKFGLAWPFRSRPAGVPSCFRTTTTFEAVAALKHKSLPKNPNKNRLFGWMFESQVWFNTHSNGRYQLYPPVKKLSKASSYWGQKSSESRQVCSRLKTPRRQKVAVGAEIFLWIKIVAELVGRVESLGKCIAIFLLGELVPEAVNWWVNKYSNN